MSVAVQPPPADGMGGGVKMSIDEQEEMLRAMMEAGDDDIEMDGVQPTKKEEKPQVMDLSHLDDASSPHVTLAFYRRLYPFKQVYQWINGDHVPSRLFTYREFAFTLPGDVYLRYNSFANADEWKKETCRLNPSRFEIGAVYTGKPRDKKTLRPAAFKPAQRELVFDIDMTDYDDIRTCSKGKGICPKCWGFIVGAMEVLEKVLREDFGFKHLLWIFSGRRGIHCWVSDPAARELSDDERKAIVGYIEVVKGGAQQAKKVNITGLKGSGWHPQLTRSVDALKPFFASTVLNEQDTFADPERCEVLLQLLPDKKVAEDLRAYWTDRPHLTSTEKWKQMQQKAGDSKVDKKIWDAALKEIILQYTYPRIDTEVSKHQNHLLKAPFCIHPGTGKVCVPVDFSRAKEFDPDTVPTVGQLLRELEALPSERDLGTDWERTSLAPYVRMLDKHIEAMMRETRSAKREAAAQSMDF